MKPQIMWAIKKDRRYIMADHIRVRLLDRMADAACQEWEKLERNGFSCVKVQVSEVKE